jgi:lysophospholipase L1-like esterase
VLYGFDVRNTDKPGIYYAALGANGASTLSVLRCRLFTQQMASIAPDLVIFSLGVNDVQDKNFSGDEYIAHYDTLVSWVRAASPGCAILFTTITDNYVRKKGPNKKSNTVEYCVQKLTQKNGAAMWDMYGIMGGYKSILKWYKAGLARKDKVHFTVRGYYIFSDLMFEAIMRSYKYNFPK